MIRVTQSRVGERGTCFRACIASILNLPERAVVDFDGPRKYLHGKQGLDDYWANVEGWLAERGLRYRRVPVGGAKPSGWSTVEGVSPRGGLHACVAHDGELVWDPHPQDGTGRGLTEPRHYGLLEPLKVKGVDLYKKSSVGGTVSPRFVDKRLFDPEYSAREIEQQKREWEDEGYEVKIAPGRITPVRSGVKGKMGIIMTAYKKATDRADMLALRRNTERQGGPFFVQETTKSGAECVLPIRELSKAADASPARVALLLAALLAWYRARKAEGRCDNYDLTRYVPKRRAFDALPLNRYPMSRLLDALGIDIKEYMRRDEAQKERLLRTAIEKLDAARADVRRRTP